MFHFTRISLCTIYLEKQKSCKVRATCIKLWGGVFEFFQFLPQKALKRGLLEQKCGVLLELCQSGGLIESGLLFAWIRYVLNILVKPHSTLLPNPIEVCPAKYLLSILVKPHST